MSEDVNSKYPRVFHALDLPDKTRITLEVIEAPNGFFVTIHFPIPIQTEPELAALVTNWVNEGIAHTINDPRPNFEQMYIGDRLIYSVMAKKNSVCGVLYPNEKGSLW